MKRFAMLLLLVLACAAPVSADILDITLHRDGTNVLCLLKGRQVAPAELQATMSRLAKFSREIPVHIRCSPETKVSDLIGLASLLKDAGLKNIVVWSEGTKGQKEGTFVFPMQMTTNSVHLCVMEETRDFIPKDELSELEPVEADVEHHLRPVRK